MKLHKVYSLAGMLPLVLLTCILAACSTSQNAGAEDNPSLPSSSSPIKAIRMLDHSKGWGLARQNILVTSDGGQSWKDVTPSGSAPGNDAMGDFMNDKYAWVVSTPQPQVSNTVNVLRTSDGGQHWQTSTISANEVSVLDYPHFLTTQEGFLELGTFGGPGAGSEAASIFHTTDGGQSWTESALPRGGIKSGISFKDVHTGWATGQDASSSPWLYMTQDGGHTWNQQSLPSLGNSVEHYETTPPVFFGNNGFLPVKISVTTNGNTSTTGTVIYKSTNGGASWSTDYPTNPNALTKFNSSDLYIQSPQNAWASDENGNNVYGTSDGGEHWSQLASNVDKIHALSFVDASYGWAVSDTKLWQTTDGGHHWSEITYHSAA